MSLPNLSGVGRLTQEPEIRFTASGMAVLTVNLAFNSRRKNPQTNEWEDGDVFFVRGTGFKQLAENAAESLTKGMEVLVSGRLKTEQWTDKQTGDKRSATGLLLDAIAPNLAYATAKVTKVQRSSDGDFSGSRPAAPPAPASAPPSDPWGDEPPPDDEPPF